MQTISHPEWMELARSFSTLTELASAYNPEVSPRSARRRLVETLRQSPQLLDELSNVGFKLGQRLLYPGQIMVIFNRLGLPKCTVSGSK